MPVTAYISYPTLSVFFLRDSYWVPTSRDEYPDMRLSRLPQVDYVVSKQSWVGRLLQRPNFELTQLMFFMNRLKQPGGQAFLSSDPAPLGANLLNWTELSVSHTHCIRQWVRIFMSMHAYHRAFSPHALTRSCIFRATEAGLNKLFYLFLCLLSARFVGSKSSHFAV